MIRTRLAIVLGVGLALGLGACSDADDDPGNAVADDAGETPDTGEADGEADGGEPYFAGKRITWIVTWDPGGNGDVYARLVAPFLEEHIPGNPTVIVEQMTGGGHNIGANFIFNQAEPDGLTIGSFPSHRVIASAVGEEGVEFDAREFTWIKNLWGGGSVCVADKDTGFESVEDLADSPEPWVIGSLAPSAAGATAVNILSEDMGWNTELILGYEGNTEVSLAMQQGEVDGMCLPWANLLTFGDQVDQVVPMFVIGTEREPSLPDVPAVSEEEFFELSPLVREAIDAYVARFAMNVSVNAPPGLPDDVTETLRRAFDAVVEDPDFVAEMEQAETPIDGNLPGEEVQEIVDAIHSASPEAWDFVLEAQSGD